MTDDTIRPTAEDDSDLTSFFGHAFTQAKRYYKLLIALLCVISVLEIAYVHIAKPYYTAIAAVTPPKDSLSSSGADAIGGISSITRRLGIGGPSTAGADLFDDYTRVLKSYRLAAALLQREDFLRTAFPDTWDPKTKQFAPRQGPIAEISDLVKGILGLPIVSNSGEERIYRVLMDNLSISGPQTNAQDITEVSFRFEDPSAAERILDIVLESADNLMRVDRRKDIAARIAYLKDQLTSTTQGDQKTAMITLLMMQQNTMMMISADHRYASNVIEPPHAPQKPTWPTFYSIIGTIIFLALVCWALAIFLLPSQSRILARFSSDRALLPWSRKRMDDTHVHNTTIVSRERRV